MKLYEDELRKQIKYQWQKVELVEDHIFNKIWSEMNDYLWDHLRCEFAIKLERQLRNDKGVE